MATAGVVFAGGSGNIDMRAVSFLGPGDGAEDAAVTSDGRGGGLGIFSMAEIVGGVGGAAVIGLGINGSEDEGGAADFPRCALLGGGEGAFDGKNGGGETRLAGGGGIGVLARGGRGAAPAPGVAEGTGDGRCGGASGMLGATPFAGGRTGRFIRTVSRAPVPAADDWAPGRGGKVMRTVSFFGSFGLAMTPQIGIKKIAQKLRVCHSLT